MCGIAGFIDFTKDSKDETLKDMISVLHHRGPDDCGFEFYDEFTCHVGLAHKRLSILDISVLGHQPMRSINERWCITYNGEIYNFKEIQKKLIKEGYIFNSNSDTEVILNAFDKWGVAAVNKFIGMFAFVIYDNFEKKIYLFRDRGGVKPLYYYWKDNILLFSSELKSFHKNPHFVKELDKDSLKLYFKHGYIVAPHTIFKNAHKLLPGHYLTCDLKDKTITLAKYWDVFSSYAKPKIKIHESEAMIETEKILRSACMYRMVSDVPVGIFLSGGYDSSLITSIIQKESINKIKTYTIGFSQNTINEATFAKKIASYLGTDHTEYYCTPQDVHEICSKIPFHYDEPFGDSSNIPTMLVSKLAVKEVKVALSADAGDEIFGGYNYYMGILKLNNYINKLPKYVRQLVSEIMDVIPAENIPYLNSTYNFKTRFERIQLLLKNNGDTNFLKTYNLQFTDKDLEKLLIEKNNTNIITVFDSPIENCDSDLLSQILASDYKTFMVDDVLAKVDRATMSVSLEGREPLLDHRLVEWAAQLPNNFKIKDGKIKKHLLKEITYKYIPKTLLDRPKMGFQSPINDWMKNDIIDIVNEYVNESRIKKEGILDYQYVNNLKQDFFNNKPINPNKLWLILMFEMWHEKWMN